MNWFVLYIWKFPGKALYLIIYKILYQISKYLHLFAIHLSVIFFWKMLLCKRGREGVSFKGNLMDLTGFFVDSLHAL